MSDTGHKTLVKVLVSWRREDGGGSKKTVEGQRPAGGCESASKNRVCICGGEPVTSASTANTAPREGGVLNLGTEAQRGGDHPRPVAPADSGELEDASWLLQ